MTINTQVTLSGPYSGNGSTTVFAFNFKVLDQEAVRVVLTGSSGVEAVQTLTTDYTVSGVGDPSGSVTMLTAPATGQTLTISLSQPMSQNSDYQTEGDFDAEEVEADFDRSTLRDQTLEGTIGRMLSFPVSDGGISGALPTIANRANKALFFDDSGLPIALPLSSATVLDGSQPDFDSRASVLTTSIPAAVTHFRTAGYSAAGDGGGALYVRAGSEPSHAGKVQSSDGAHWEIVPDDDNCLRARCFGGSWDDVADDTSALQDCHDAALAMKCDMRINAETVRASNFRTGSSTAFVTPPRIFGQGDTHNADSGISGPSTVITAFATTHPVMVIEGARRPEISGIAFDGGVDTSAYSASGETPTLEATWTTVFGADSRYAPFCAIAIDPYLGTAPAGGYSGVTYHSKQSSDISLKRLVIRNFPVGVALQPCDADSNGDFLTLEEISIQNCKYGISIGNGQSRNVGGFKINGANLHTVIATNVHGRQVGSIRGHFDNCSFAGYVGRIFSIGSVSTAGPFSFTNLYVESLHRIGDFSGNTSERAITFRDSNFGFRHASQNIHPAQVMGSSGAPVYFTGCVFNGFDKILSFLASNCVWNGGTASYPTDTTDTDLQAATHGLISGSLNDPNSRHELFKSLDFVDYYSSPTAETRNATGVSVSGLTVTFATAGSFVTYPVGTLMRDRDTGTLMLRASETTATLLTNHDETDIIESLSATMNTDWLALP